MSQKTHVSDVVAWKHDKSVKGEAHGRAQSKTNGTLLLGAINTCKFYFNIKIVGLEDLTTAEHNLLTCDLKWGSLYCVSVTLYNEQKARKTKVFSVMVIFKFVCKFICDIFILANRRTFITNAAWLGRRTVEQMDMPRCIPNLKVVKNVYALWGFPSFLQRAMMFLTKKWKI